MHILVVDDDTPIRQLLKTFLCDQGFEVTLAESAREARALFSQYTFDVAVIDVMMPGEDGLSLTRNFKEFSDMPILLLTARDHIEYKLKGFESGADDYLVKPFEPLELCARLRSLFRRKDPVGENFLYWGGFRFDRAKGELFLREERVPLSSTEQILIKTLAQKPFEPFSREDLAYRVGYCVTERSVDVQMARLRRKIGDNPKEPQWIRTIRHVGYALYPETKII